MALLAAQQVTITGLTPSFTAASAGGDTVAPDDRVFLRVKNTDAAAKTVTVAVPGSVYGQARPDVAVNVPATTGDVLIGPLVGDLANDATGVVDITYSAVTGVTVAAVRV